MADGGILRVNPVVAGSAAMRRLPEIPFAEL
jgi:hypothetical protein